MSETIQVFLCDDHTLFRQGIKKLLSLEKNIKVIGEASNGQEMLEALKKVSPDVILMDINMPQMDGVSATYRIKKKYPNVNVIFLTVFEDEPHIFQAIKAGATGYLLKDVSIEDVVEAIYKVSKGEALLQPVIASKVLREFAMLDKRKIKNGDKFYSNLTVREEEILRLIALGGTNKDIAQKLGIAEKTVKNHISNIFSVLHVNNRTQAALYTLGRNQ
mgnify:CR=1 FL=1